MSGLSISTVILFSLSLLVSSDQKDSGERVDAWKCSIGLYVICDSTSERTSRIQAWEQPTEDECWIAVLYHEYNNTVIDRTNEPDVYESQEFADLAPWDADCVRGRKMRIESCSLSADSYDNSQIGNSSDGNSTFMLIWGLELLDAKEWSKPTDSVNLVQNASPIIENLSFDPLNKLDEYLKKGREIVSSKLDTIPSIGKSFLNQTKEAVGTVLDEAAEQFNNIPSIGESVANKTKEAVVTAIDERADDILDDAIPFLQWIVVIVALVVVAIIGCCALKCFVCCTTTETVFGVNATEAAPQRNFPYYNYAY